MSDPVLDHVALLVRDVDAACVAAVAFGHPVGSVQDFPGEGTREVYVGEEGQRARLLLMQPLGDSGPYARALARRGPGLHHVALDVPDIDAFLARIAGTGWLLHPATVRTLAAGRTAWLARPGAGALIEVHETTDPPQGDAVVTRVRIPVTGADSCRLIGAFRPAPIAVAKDGVASIEIAGRVVAVASLS